MVLLLLVAACDERQVEVGVAQPFPTAGTDMPNFAPRDQGHYYAGPDTTDALVLSARTLVRQQWQLQKISRRQLGSLGVPRRRGRWWAGSRHSWVQALGADSFQLSRLWRDTLFSLAGAQPGKLRRYKGWYYLSTPDPETPADGWQVQRLAVRQQHLEWQQLNPDSLRLQALDASMLELQRRQKTLHFTIQARSGRAARQLNSYAGLWLPQGTYERRL